MQAFGHVMECGVDNTAIPHVVDKATLAGSGEAFL